VWRSFRPLTAAERAGIREQRLRIVSARTGETVAALAARVGSAWKPDMIAVANDLRSDESLAAGQKVKVAIEEAYRGDGERSAAAGAAR
jgi:predicted Zn-dependent protease